MKQIAKNKKAFFQFTIIEKFEAGIVLCGSEIKSIREGKINFVDSYCESRNGELFLVGLNIASYKDASYNNHNPVAPRKLLLHKKQINKISSQINERGLTCAPLLVYLNNKNIVKLEIALVKGKRLFDKRDSIKKNDLKMEHYASVKIRNI